MACYRATPFCLGRIEPSTKRCWPSWLPSTHPGPTEEHLVKELAGIIWRKRRLRLAEAAIYREQIRGDATGYSREDLGAAALLPLTGHASHRADIARAAAAELSETARKLEETKRKQTMTREAWDILAKGEPDVLTEGRRSRSCS